MFGLEVKPLEESENAWKPNAKSKEEVDALEKLLRTTKGLLNKFTPEKFEKLTDQFLELEITCRTDMIAVIDLVFDKALFEPIFGFMYSQLCVRCAEKFPEFPDENNPDAKPHTFKRLLLNKCQEEFEKENVVAEELKRLSEDTPAEEKELIRKKAKNRMLGNIRFIGELYKTKMLTEKIMHECVIKLLGDVKNPDLDEVESLVKLLTSIGKMIDHTKSKEYMDAYFHRIRDMSTNQNLPNRVRFMLQEVIELRRGAWKERKADPTLQDALTKKLEDNLEEYMNVGDTAELCTCLAELTPRMPAGRADSLGLSLLSIAFPKAFDARDNGPREKVAKAIGALGKAKPPLLKGAELKQFFKDGLEFLEDEVVDVPYIASYYASFLAHAIGEGLVPLAFLGEALQPLVEATLVKADQAVDGHAGAAFILVKVLENLKAVPGAGGEAGVKDLYAKAKLDVSTLLPAGRRSDTDVASLLGAAGVSFVDPSLADTVKRAEEAAAAEAAAQQLSDFKAYLSSGVLKPSDDEGSERPESLEAVHKWMEDNLSSRASTDAKVARVCMRCVLEAAPVDEGGVPTALKLCKQIERCAKLIRACTHSKETAVQLCKQAGCLYEVQAFCGTRGWPQGLIKKLFYNLYETDVVFEDAYGVWREDVNDETPGKDKALFQVNEFLQWLDEAAEEGEEEGN